MKGIIALNIISEEDNNSYSITFNNSPLIMYWAGEDNINKIIIENEDLKEILYNHAEKAPVMIKRSFIYYRAYISMGDEEDSDEKTFEGKISIKDIIDTSKLISHYINQKIKELTDEPESLTKETIVNWIRKCCNDDNMILKDTKKIISEVYVILNK